MDGRQTLPSLHRISPMVEPGGARSLHSGWQLAPLSSSASPGNGQLPGATSSGSALIVHESPLTHSPGVNAPFTQEVSPVRTNPKSQVN